MKIRSQSGSHNLLNKKFLDERILATGIRPVFSKIHFLLTFDFGGWQTDNGIGISVLDFLIKILMPEVSDHVTGS